MQPMIDNRIISSFLLYLDNQILTQTSAYVNTRGLFYHANSVVNGLTAYTCSYKQLVNDISIPGANVMSGVYINNVYTPVGSGGLYAINHCDGALYFSTPPAANAVISGNFAVKEVNTYLSDQPDYKLLFATKYSTNPKYGQAVSGAPLDSKVAPAVFLTIKSQENRPFAFAGLDDNAIKFRAIIVANSLYQKIAIANVIKNFRLKNLKVIDFTTMPIDYLGNMTGVNYNYTGLSGSSYYRPIILKSSVVDAPNQTEYTDAYRQFAIADIDVSTWAGHA